MRRTFDFWGNNEVHFSYCPRLLKKGIVVVVSAQIPRSDRPRFLRAVQRRMGVDHRINIEVQVRTG